MTFTIIYCHLSTIILKGPNPVCSNICSIQTCYKPATNYPHFCRRFLSKVFFYGFRFFSTKICDQIFAIFHFRQKSILARIFVENEENEKNEATLLIPFCAKWFLPQSVFVHFRFFYFSRQKSDRQELICANTLFWICNPGADPTPITNPEFVYTVAGLLLVSRFVHQLFL